MNARIHQIIGVVKRIARNMGFYSVRRAVALPGSANRPIGNMEKVLADLRHRGFSPDSILDVGANRGDWTQTALKVFPEATFLLVEPVGELSHSLDRLCATFANVSWKNIAVGPAAGTTHLYVDSGFDGSTLLMDEVNPDPAFKARPVDVITIDSLFPDAATIPDLVKMDIQGFELEALKGAQSLFGKTEVFILETSLFEFIPGTPVFHEVVDFFKNQNYVLYDIAGSLRRPRDGALAQLDTVFVYEHGRLRNSNDWD